MASIRKGTALDEKAYLDTQFRVFPGERVELERHRKYFAQKAQNGEILVLEDQQDYLGHFTFAKMISSPFPDCIYLEEAAILENYRRVGNGTQLIQALIVECKAVGFHQIWTNTTIARNNRDAINFYQKMGFKRQGKVIIRGVSNMLLRLIVEK